MASPRLRAAGYSLVELMIAIAIGLVVVAGALGLLQGQMRAFQTGSTDRALQETARVALSHITASLRSAGYGVDPALVFDFGPLNAARIASTPTATYAAASARCNAGAAVCRDRIDGPDEISFLARDPLFGPHVLTAAPVGDTLTVSGPLREPLRRGQMLQVLCYSGTRPWAYVTVAQEVPATTADTFTVTLAAGATDIPNQLTLLANTCFSRVGVVDAALTTYPRVTPASMPAAAKVFKVDRYHYFIRSYTDAGDEVAWGTAGSRPYLMLDQGLEDAAGTPIEDVIAPDVEDLQFAYQFPLAAADQVVGNTPGTALVDGATGIDLGATAPLLTDLEPTPTNATNKGSHHPGNIRAVQVGVVVRSPVPDIAIPGDELPALGNRPAVAMPDNRRRLSVQTTTAVRNLAVELLYFPSYDASVTIGGG